MSKASLTGWTSAIDNIQARRWGFVKGEKLIPLLMIVAGLTAYSNSLHNPFIFDDEPFIVANAAVRKLWPPWNILTHSSRPVLLLSLATNYALGGLDPWGYHVFNLGTHVLAALVLYGIVRRTLVSETLRAKWGSRAPWLAGAVALIWLVHPLQTESVTYIIQRSESLMGLFYFLTLYCVIRNWHVAALVACALGMACKPVMLTAPIMVLLYDRVFLARSWRELMRQRGAIHIGLATTWLLLPVLLANGPQDWKNTAGFGYNAVRPLPYALTQAGVILHYLRLVLWPHPLCLDYGWVIGWPAVQTAKDALSDLTVVGGLLAVTVWAWWRKPALGFLGAWFFIILAPTSSFIPIADVVFEHRMYLPLAAVVTAVVLGASALGENLPIAYYKFSPVLGCAVGGAVVVLLGILTVERNRDYRSALAIWQDTVTKCPNNPRGHLNLGNAFLQKGKLQDAVAHYDEALRIAPEYTQARNNVASALLQAGNVQRAIEQYQLAVRGEPNIAQIHYNLAIALQTSGRFEDAIVQFRKALELKPGSAEGYLGLGKALATNHQYQEAIQVFRRGLEIEPRHMVMGDEMAWILATAPEAAVRNAPQAILIGERLAELTHHQESKPLDTLAAAYAEAGRFDDAVRTAREALDAAEAQRATNSVAQIKERLALYRQGKPYRLTGRK